MITQHSTVRIIIIGNIIVISNHKPDFKRTQTKRQKRGNMIRLHLINKKMNSPTMPMVIFNFTNLKGGKCRVYLFWF